MESQLTRILGGRYELSHLVARGGMAEVYRAHDRLLDRPVALKVLFPELSVDRTFVERFRREAQAAANLSDARIVPVFDWGEDDGTYFIVMEFVDGRALSLILRGAGPLHPDRAAEIGADVAKALDYAHRHGVVHRDVKPGNVLITDEGVVKVADFGIARAINTEESLTQTGAVMGTATYFSPEQAEGLGVDARSDIYSLGVVLYEMVTGRPPFLGESPVAVASKHVREVAPTPREINPAVPPDLEAIILKCLAKPPEHRYASGEDLCVDLLRFREGRAVSADIPATLIQAYGGTQMFGAVPGGTQMMGAVGGPMVAEPAEACPSHTGRYLLVLLVLLVALGAVVFYLGRSLGWWDRQVSVPQIANMTLTSAEHQLTTQGFKFKTQRDPASSSVPTSQVVGTKPPAGTRITQGSTVTVLTGSQVPPAEVKVPDETGASVSAAQSDLTALGLVPKVQASSSGLCSQGQQNAEVNVVCDQSPEGGGGVANGSTVTLYTPPTTVTIPSVTGDSVGQACNTLGKIGLSCANSTQSEPSGTVGANDVISTNPPGGSQEPLGTVVTLTVSSGTNQGPGPGPGQVQVPGEVGQTLSNAEQAIGVSGLTVGQINCSPKNNGLGNGQATEVTQEQPQPGTQVAAGSTVSIAENAFKTCPNGQNPAGNTGNTGAVSSTTTIAIPPAPVPTTTSAPSRGRAPGQVRGVGSP